MENNEIKIYRKFVDSNEIKETTWEEAIDKLEDNEFWKKGSVKKLLESGQVVWNPFCRYSIDTEQLK